MARLSGVLVGVLVALCAVASAAMADVTVYAGSDGVVHVIEDSGVNDVHFTEAVHYSSNSYGTWDFGTEIWNTSGSVIMQGGDNATGGTSGCTTDSGGVNPGTVICGSSAANAVDVQGGSGGGSIVYDVTEFLAGGIPLRSIAIDGGTGSKSIDLSLLDYDTNTVVQGGGGNQTIKTGHGSAVIHAGSGNDHISVGSGDNNQIFGDTGSQDIEGTGGGNAVINGGAGADTIVTNTGYYPSDVTVNAVGGGVDRINCTSLDTDIVNVDQNDIVNKAACSQVNVTYVGGCPSGQVGTPPNCAPPCPSGQIGTPPHCAPNGHATPQPKPVVYASHCVKRHGHRVCSRPHPLKKHAYSGLTGQHRTITLSVDKSGSYVAVATHALRFTCGDGYSALEDVAIRLADHVRISKNGAFAANINYVPADGWTQEVVYIVGAFDGHNAKGALVGNAQIAGHGVCTTGRVSWTAKG